MTPRTIENPRLRTLLTERDRLDREIGSIKAACKVHAVKRSGDSAYCSNCGDDLGWWCPKSPDHLCRYLPGREDCSLCGEPTERK
jgi:hypothetical protein